MEMTTEEAQEKRKAARGLAEGLIEGRANKVLAFLRAIKTKNDRRRKWKERKGGKR
jgi:hypothetical protein